MVNSSMPVMSSVTLYMYRICISALCISDRLDAISVRPLTLWSPYWSTHIALCALLYGTFDTGHEGLYVAHAHSIRDGACTPALRTKFYCLQIE